MNVCALQLAQAWGDRAGALARAEAAVAALTGVDLVLLPELAFTGYLSPRGDADLRPFAEPLEGPCLQAAAQWAERYQLAIAAPLAEEAGGQYFNALLLFDETGRRIGHWRKRHPWFPEQWATPGNLGTPVIAWRGRQIAAAICYDLHFLPRDAASELQQADLLLFPSAWVEEARDTRVQRLQNLARRFDVSIVNANWGRGNPWVPGQGRSVILDRRGNLLAQARGDAPEAVLAELADAEQASPPR